MGLEKVCQIFVGKTYQNGKNIPNHHKIYQKATKYSKCPQNIPTFCILCPTKINLNEDFRFENIPSGNPGVDHSPEIANPFL
jgi:hypothetical protein